MSNLTNLKKQIVALPAEYTATWHDKEGNPFDIDHADLQALASSHDALLAAAKAAVASIDHMDEDVDCGGCANEAYGILEAAISTAEGQDE